MSTPSFLRAASLGLVLIFAPSIHADEAKPDAAAIMKKVGDRKVPDNSVSHVELTIKKDGDPVVKVFKAYAMRVTPEESYNLIEFEKPVTTKILAYVRAKGDDDRWVKTSGGQPRRVSQGSGDQSFVQSHFSYTDLEVGKGEDLTHEALCEGGKCQVDFAGAPHYRIKSTPKTPGTYAYTINVVRVSDNFLSKVEYYGEGGKKVKELTVDATKDVDGFTIPMQVTMKMADNGESSVMKTLEVQVNSKDVTKQKFDKNLL